MVPGTVSWAIIIGPIWLSFSYPWLVAYFVLSFDFYWLCRALWFAGAVIVAFRRIRGVQAQDWWARARLARQSQCPARGGAAGSLQPWPAPCRAPWGSPPAWLRAVAASARRWRRSWRSSTR